MRSDGHWTESWRPCLWHWVADNPGHAMRIATAEGASALALAAPSRQPRATRCVRLHVRLSVYDAIISAFAAGETREPRGERPSAGRVFAASPFVSSSPQPPRPSPRSASPFTDDPAVQPPHAETLPMAVSRGGSVTPERIGRQRPDSPDACVDVDPERLSRGCEGSRRGGPLQRRFRQPGDGGQGGRGTSCDQRERHAPRGPTSATGSGEYSSTSGVATSVGPTLNRSSLACISCGKRTNTPAGVTQGPAVAAIVP
jgi:hypothetical protein